MDRRNFSKKLALASLLPSAGIRAMNKNISIQKPVSSNNMIRLGGPIFKDEYDSPDSWTRAVKQKGYTAARCPVDLSADNNLIEEYKSAAQKENIVIAEVGAWSNPIHPDLELRKAAMDKCIASLNLADRIGANCCVNVTGSRGTEKFWGAHPENLTHGTFDMIVEVTRKIMDAVKPNHTYYTLEMMPTSYPDSVESYLELIRAIDRPRFAVHFDPVNLMNSPDRYFNNADLIKDAFSRLGKYIKSCHAKDTRLINDQLTIHIDEAVPGTGYLDYKAYLSGLSKLQNVPLIMEHMKREEYPVAADYIRKTGEEMGLKFE